MLDRSPSGRSETQETHETTSGSAEGSSQATLDMLREEAARLQPLAGIMEGQHQQPRQKILERKAEEWENIVGTEAWQSKEVQEIFGKLEQEIPGTRSWNIKSAELIVEYEEQIEKFNAIREENGEKFINLVNHLNAIKRALDEGGHIYEKVKLAMGASEEANKRRNETQPPVRQAQTPFEIDRFLGEAIAFLEELRDTETGHDSEEAHSAALRGQTQ